MSALSDEYSKNFSAEKKAEFNRRFRDDYDPNMSELSNILLILEEMRLSKSEGGIMRLGFQDGTPDRQLYETPITDAIKSVNEKTQDLIMQGKDAFDRFSGIDEVYDFPGAGSAATGASSDFRHQAASNLLAEALGKGKAGPIGYLSGGIGSFGLGTIKEIGDFVAGVLDKNTTTKEAFDQALEDTISNFKGAFAPTGTTTEDLYAELMKDYQPIKTGMFDPFGMDREFLRSQRIFAQKKAMDELKKKQKDTITPIKKPIKTTTGTTKPGTGGGGGGFTPTTTAQNIARTASRVDPSGNVKAYGLAKGGLAAMLGEFDDRVTFQGGGRDASQSDFDTPSNNNTGGGSTNREKGIMSRGLGPKGTTGDIRDFVDTGPDDRSTPEQKARHNLAVDLARGVYSIKRPNIVNRLMRNPIFRTLLYTTNPFEVGRKAINVYDVVTGAYDDIVNPELGDVAE